MWVTRRSMTAPLSWNLKSTWAAGSNDDCPPLPLPHPPWIKRSSRNSSRTSSQSQRQQNVMIYNKKSYISWRFFLSLLSEQQQTWADNERLKGFQLNSPRPGNLCDPQTSRSTNSNTNSWTDGQSNDKKKTMLQSQRKENIKMEEKKKKQQSKARQRNWLWNWATGKPRTGLCDGGSGQGRGTCVYFV